MRNEEVKIFLRKKIVIDITTQNFRFRYTKAYGISHHGVTSFSVLSLYPTTISHPYIAQQAEAEATMIIFTDNKNAMKKPPTLPSPYIELSTVLPK